MKCDLCLKSNLLYLKKVSGVRIYECSQCKIAYIEKKGKSKDLSHIYSFKDYKSNEKTFKLRLEKQLTQIYQYINKGSVLEIGAGYGLLCSLLLEKGKYTIDVVEPSLVPHYLKKSKHVNKTNFALHKKTFDNFLKDNKKKFDMVIMIDVIEHFNKPSEILSKIHKIMKKDGILVIQTPNYKSVMQKMVQNWSWWMVEDHKLIYSHNSLIQTLNKTGYLKQYFSSYEDWTDFKKNLDGNFSYIQPSLLRKSIKGLFYSLFFPLYFLTRPIFWRNGYGGLLFVIAKRTG